MANRWEVMSEYCREQHPLLCEEASEEEHYSPRYYPRIRPSNFKGRAKNNLKGAAAILTRWPDHWTSFLTYWWIGLGMISLTTFIVYNTLYAFAMLPSVSMKPANPLLITENNKTSRKNVVLPEVYMHVFVDQNEGLDLNQYLPYVEIISTTFVDYKFNFIIIVNDTNTNWLGDAENNELALNKLFTQSKNVLKKESYNRNINIEHITLSAFMDNSPLRKYWRTLPHQLIEFVARTVSIWDKGGVAFNPNILTPRFQHTLYIEKLQKLLNKYADTNKVVNQSNIISNLKINKLSKKHRKLNNIRDIIDALENEDISGNAFPQQKLSEAENNDVISIRHEREALVESSIKNVVANTEALKSNNAFSTANTNKSELDEIVNSTESTYILADNANSTKMSLLPLFLDFLFHNRGKVPLTNRTRKNAVLTPTPQSDDSPVKNSIIPTEKVNITNKPVVLSIAEISNKSDINTTKSQNKQSHENLETNRLTIDLKGNIIATDTACHAFLGTIFSNIVHHNNEETITDFIIAELSIFCKGLLTSCMGIDLILL